jgi:large subunit ribosomal protein L6
MSRIGKQHITIPAGVTVTVDGLNVSVKGPKGEMSYLVHKDIAVKVIESEIVCEIARQSKQASALWGTTRARLANIVTGVSEGFKKQLELRGVGYRATMKGNDLQFALGYSHPIIVTAPAGITFSVEKEFVTVEGVDNVLVGQVSADIRRLRKPEPYKGKGVRYVGEHVRHKVGKVVGSSGE